MLLLEMRSQEEWTDELLDEVLCEKYSIFAHPDIHQQSKCPSSRTVQQTSNDDDDDFIIQPMAEEEVDIVIPTQLTMLEHEGEPSETPKLLSSEDLFSELRWVAPKGWKPHEDSVTSEEDKADEQIEVKPEILNIYKKFQDLLLNESLDAKQRRSL